MRRFLLVAVVLLCMGLVGCDRLGPSSDASERGKLKLDEPADAEPHGKKGDIEGRPSPVGGGIIYDADL